MDRLPRPPMSNRKTLAVTLGIIVAMLTIHGTILTSAILHQVTGIVRGEMREHRADTHPGSARREDVQALSEMILRRLERIEARLDEALKR